MEIFCTSARQHLHANIMTTYGTLALPVLAKSAAQQLWLFISHLHPFLQEIETLPEESGFITIFLLFFLQVWVTGGRQRLDWTHEKH